MTGAVVLPIRQNTPEWEQAREGTIGSADIAVIVGESPHKSARELAAERLHLIEPVIDADTRRLWDIGHILQPGLLAIYTHETGRKVRNVHAWRAHPRNPRLTASLDGTAATRRVVEAKWTNSSRWNEGLPPDVEIQVQWQLFITGWDVADVVVLHGPNSSVIEVPRDQEWIDDLEWHALHFLSELDAGRLPPADGSESGRRVLTRMHPRDNGVYLEPSEEFDQLAAALRVAKAEAKGAADHQGSIENAIRALLGDASGVKGDGYSISWKRNRDGEAIDHKAVIASATEAGLDLAPFLAAHTTVREGARVLRVTFKGEPTND